MDLKQSDLDDLATIDLSDSFIEANLDISKRFDECTSRTTLQDVCAAFVQSFLVEKGEWISSLHVSLKECLTVLEGMETVLEKFIEQLDRIQHDIGEVRETLAKTSIGLNNARVTERVLWTAISHLVVPPELVQIVTRSNDGELGMLFQLTLRELLKYLNYRKGTWQRQQPAPAEVRGSAASPDTRSGTAPQRASRELRLPLTEFTIYTELLSILDGLTVFACIKVRDFLSRKLYVLTVPNTNVCIQQENSLKQHAVFVHFLRSAPPLLRHTFARGTEGNHQLTLVPYRITRAIYNEFKQQYCLIMSSLYLRKFQGYILTLNAMEYSTATSASFGSVGSNLLSGFTRIQPAAPETVYTLPSLTAVHSRGSPVDDRVFQLGQRGEIFARVFAPPLIPTLEKAAGRWHSYEETLRSVLHLLSDTVTHEYLFTFEFFAGDTSVHVDVFQPTLQFIVDYVSEAMLLQSSGNVRQLMNQHPHASVNQRAKDDTYGLLILIRICHEYRFYMKTVRKLACLDTFFESLLVLLWPTFKRTFDAQLVALRCAQVPSLAAVTAHMRSVAERIATVHPLVRNYTALSCSLLGIALGAALAEERMGTAQSEQTNPAQQSDRSSSTTSSSSSAGHIANAGNSGGGRSSPRPAAPRNSSSLDVSRSTFTALMDNAASRAWDDPEHAELRRVAVQMMAAEDEEDAAESQSRFVALVGNIDFLRVQVIHYAEEIVKHILAHADLTASSQSVGGGGDAAVMRDAYVVNQLHYMLTAAQCAVFPGEERRGTTLADRFDFSHLRSMYSTYRTRLLEELLDMRLYDFINVARSGEEVPPPVLLRIADHFLLSWKPALDAMRTQVMSLMYDAQLAHEVIAQACMECLVCNTRFLKIISAAVESHPSAFAQRPIRTLIVSNQHILLHMRNYSMHVDPSSLQR
ncbi:Vps52 / Sac2 family [Leishmania donovani]|uniref:Vps52 / Sac2 family protein n=1 Tax=Leishmania donovani TaxID=5661 RepID=A0A504XTK3_LEIDO|nr:Vps52 / Sac2 family protein [Leishmania donovani]CAJ1989622.1 Vps52 / Sac2 family [Leishmania donovani]VDZ45488.1 Vps52_/_Sac2_family_putative/Pfam:PF04129 [Leishmania donovani]